MRRGHSGIFDSRNPVDGFHELAPGALLRGQHGGARLRQPVVAAPALAGLLNPAALDPAAFLEAVQQRIKRRDAELEDAARARLYEFAKVVALPRLIAPERLNQELRAAFLELPVEDGRFHILHSD